VGSGGKSSAAAPDWRLVVQQRAIAFVGMVAFPRLAYWLRWPTRLGPRGFIAYVAFNTLLLFALRTWVMAFFKRVVEERERAERVLCEQLGREPTEDEVLAHLGITRGSSSSARP
jgi:hypothetical protein